MADGCPFTLLRSVTGNGNSAGNGQRTAGCVVGLKRLRTFPWPPVDADLFLRGPEIIIIIIIIIIID